MSTLDRLIYSIALREAEDHLRIGFAPEEAAALATPGAWVQYRPLIVDALRPAAAGAARH